MVKQQARAASGPSGVVGDSARGKISRGAWEARHGGERKRARYDGYTEPAERPSRESERPIVAGKLGNARGAKGPYGKQESVRGGETAWRKVPLRRLGRPQERRRPGAVGADPSIGTCACLRRELSGEADAGNPHLRFDEGGSGSRCARRPLSYSTGSLRGSYTPNP